MQQARLFNTLESILETPVEDFLMAQKRHSQSVLMGKELPLLLFGSGFLGRHTLRCLRKSMIEPIAFVDNASHLWGSVIDGLPVESPSEAFRKHKGSALFVVTLYNNAKAMKQLEEASVDYLTFAEFAWEKPESLMPHYAIDFPYSIHRHSSDIRQVFDILADDESKAEFVAQINWRTSLDRSWDIAHKNPELIYFDPEFVRLDGGNVIVDCGAFDGDTIRELVNKEVNFTKLIAIEPDDDNFLRLQQYLMTLNSDLKERIEVHKLVVSSESGTVGFDKMGDGKSGINHMGKCEVEKVSLDSLLACECPTLIKMDIEGAEYDALLGCRSIINKHHPMLAISLYHTPEDLWRIPLLISKLYHGYNLHIRRYADDCWEQVCYAIPRV